MGRIMGSVKKISILVPIYNVEKYLRQCLGSLINQSLQEIEIVCINDGSTDDSLKIVKEFAKNDDRIVIIDKENTGYGDSMNQGLEVASGDYIAIVEPDDYIDVDAMERLYAMASTYNAEVVRANYYFNKNGQDKKNCYVHIDSTGRAVDPYRHTWIFYEAPAIWSAIYRREFLNQHSIRFLPTAGASYQDTGFNFKVWASAKRAVFTNEAFLHYRIDNESSSVNNPGKVMNVIYEYEEIERFLRDKKIFKKYAPIFTTAKFGAYFWNIYRLKTKLLPKFLEKVQKEYKELDAEGYIHLENFEGRRQRSLLKVILKRPIPLIIVHVRITSVWYKVQDYAKSMWLKLHPLYKKQLAMAELIAEAHANNCFMAMKIKELEQRINDEK